MKSLSHKIIFLFLVFSLPIISQDLILSPTTLYLGSIPIGSHSIREIVIFNSTITSINISSISISGPDATNFSIENDPGSTSIGPIRSLIIKIKYSPINPSENIAFLNISSSSGNFIDTLKGIGNQSIAGIFPFERILGTPEIDRSANVIQTNDNGFIFIGSTFNDEYDVENIFLLKTDNNGMVEWTSEYGDDNGIENGVDIIQTDDNGYLVLANTEKMGNFGGNDLMIVKFNSVGEYQWKKYYGTTQDDFASKMVTTLNGDYIILAQTLPTSGISKNTMLIRIDNEGNEKWQKYYGNELGNQSSDIIRLADNNLVFIGFIAIGDDRQIYLVKVNDDGNVIWEKTFGGSLFEEGSSVRETQDGGLIICGFTASEGSGAKDAYLAKLNSTGELIWSKIFGDIHDDGFGGVIETTNGDFISVGSTVTEFLEEGQKQYTDVLVVKTNNNGDMIWSRNFGGNRSDGAGQIFRANDGGYIINGNTSSYSKSSDIYVLKMNGDGVISDINEELFEDNLVLNDIELWQNYPNPFNSQTNILFYLNEADDIKISLFSINGELLKVLADKKYEAGIHEIKTTLNNISSGLYLYELRTSSNRKVKTMVYIK
ncbi:MAG: T9SS type A sorting domain-containing protein [Ignavibacteriales bacterium]|nr:T9SS type A sorting domain-containing protein [Ignavibacteriales bacterium]MCB9259831.1 T9SS type A sorting domain-containing protein [Ignavibacteriales bacterium]